MISKGNISSSLVMLAVSEEANTRPFASLNEQDIEDVEVRSLQL